MATADDLILEMQTMNSRLGRLIALAERFAANIPKPIADDADLDGQYGDEPIKFLPRDWSGEDYKNRRMSQTEPAFLDALAKAFDYFGDTNEAKGEKTDKGVPKATYDRRSAARARGWAQRLRAGFVSSAAAASAVSENDDIKF